MRVLRDQIEGSIEATASDSRLPDYIFDTDGEILDIKADYAWVKSCPTVANTWFKLDHLTAAAK